ncbi:porin family protein [Chryseobacterium gossypii]|uniref:porin family protein n=1 Tax=Chryseobacterium gossypii TaxID=3231602 RepID=UPI0035241038
MKKLILGFAFAASLLSNAQEKAKSPSHITFGVKAGFNASTLTENNVEYENDQKFKIGINAGGFVNIPIAEKFSVQPEVLFSQGGSKTKDIYKYYSDNYNFKQEYDYKMTLNYIVLPVMLQYNILPQFYVEAGPEFGLLLGGKSKGNGTYTQTSGNNTTTSTQEYSNKLVMDLYNKFNFGIGVGAGYYFTHNFGVTGRFTAGITDILKNNSGDSFRNNAVQIGVAYKFK